MTGIEIALAAGLAAAAVSAGTAVYSGVQAKEQADAQAKVMRQQARYEREAAAAAEQDFRRDQSRLMARRRALLGGTGIVSSTGSPLLASEDFAGEVELQALRIRHGGEVGATRLQQQAALERAAGKASLIGGAVQGGSLLLSGAGGSYYDYRTASG